MMLNEKRGCEIPPELQVYMPSIWRRWKVEDGLRGVENLFGEKILGEIVLTCKYDLINIPEIKLVKQIYFLEMAYELFPGYILDYNETSLWDDEIGSQYKIPESIIKEVEYYRKLGFDARTVIFYGYPSNDFDGCDRCQWLKCYKKGELDYYKEKITVAIFDDNFNGYVLFKKIIMM